jgi:hypothetical protein
MSEPLLDPNTEESLIEETPPAGFEHIDVDTTSYHPHPAMSPQTEQTPEPRDGVPYDRLFGHLGADLAREASTSSSNDSGESSRPHSVFLGEALGRSTSSTGDGPFRPDSIASLSDLSSSANAEEMHQLLKAYSESSKRIKELERAREAMSHDHEADLVKLQSSLEDANAELAARRRDEKELRSKERQYTESIQSLESEVAKLQKQLDKQKELHAGLYVVPL